METTQLFPNLDKLDLRTLTKFLSGSNIAALAQSREKNQFELKLKRFLSKRNIQYSECDTLGAALDLCYSLLLQTYRTEYIYKNELVKNLLVENYQLEETVILNEFKAGKSIADTVFLNGIDKVFEIKTEFDSPDRLRTQLRDYKKVFTHVYVVVNEEHYPKYKNLVSDVAVGFITFSSKMALQLQRKATFDGESLCSDTMMRSLRKPEYLELVRSIFRDTPNVGDVKLFKACIEWLKEVDPLIVHEQFINILKRRKASIQSTPCSTGIPSSLTYLCSSLNLKEKEYISMVTRLQKKFN